MRISDWSRRVLFRSLNGRSGSAAARIDVRRSAVRVQQRNRVSQGCGPSAADRSNRRVQAVTARNSHSRAPQGCPPPASSSPPCTTCCESLPPDKPCSPLLFLLVSRPQAYPDIWPLRCRRVFFRAPRPPVPQPSCNILVGLPERLRIAALAAPAFSRATKKAPQGCLRCFILGGAAGPRTPDPPRTQPGF